jgi:hypothetical protein
LNSIGIRDISRFRDSQRFRWALSQCFDNNSRIRRGSGGRLMLKSGRHRALRSTAVRLLLAVAVIFSLGQAGFATDIVWAVASGNCRRDALSLTVVAGSLGLRENKS